MIILEKMITLYVIGFICFLLHLYILKHTYWVKVIGQRYDSSMDKELQPLEIPLWAVLLGLLIIAIPIVGVFLESFIFWVLWFKKYSDPENGSFNTWYTYWRFKDKFLTKAI